MHPFGGLHATRAYAELYLLAQLPSHNARRLLSVPQPFTAASFPFGPGFVFTDPVERVDCAIVDPVVAIRGADVAGFAPRVCIISPTVALANTAVNASNGVFNVTLLSSAVPVKDLRVVVQLQAGSAQDTHPCVPGTSR